MSLRQLSCQCHLCRLDSTASRGPVSPAAAGPFSFPSEVAMALVRSNKRQKEQARLERQKEKDERRDKRSVEKANRPARAPGEEDPDIAGIVPGPQPVLEE